MFAHRIHVNAYGLAAGAVMAVLYTLCALAVAIWPVGFAGFVGYITHVDLAPLARHITWASYFAGLFCWSAFAAVSFAALAWTYNRLLRGTPLRTHREAEVTITQEREFEGVIR